METSIKKMASHLTDIPDHLLAEIFLRVPTPEDLARASAACVPFRRITTDRSFIRRFRCLHAPPLLAFLDPDGFHPALPPHPSAPAACALALAADFSFSFLPSHCRWRVQDIRGGLVLLNRITELDEEMPNFTELVVCDPLHRRYVLLPPVPDHLVPSMEHPMPTPELWCVPLLVPLSEEAATATAMEEETSFRVIWLAHYQTMMSAFVFSSSTGEWIAAASKGWSDLGITSDHYFMASQISPCFIRRSYAYGCFYWYLMISTKKVLLFDTRKMEFSVVVDLPPGKWSKEGIAIVEAGEGRLGMFGFHGQTASDLSYTIAQNKGERPSQWQMEKTISLDSGYKYYIKAATDTYLLLIRTAALPRPSLGYAQYEYFSMDVKTLQLQRVCVKQCQPMMLGTHICTNFPPSLLSSPSI